MINYFSYFIDGQDQFLTLLSVLLLWFGLAGIGALVTGLRREYEATPLYGWAVAVVLFTFAGVLTAIPFTYVAVLLAFLAIPATVVALRRPGGLLAAGSVKIFFIGLPLVLVSTAMVASQWDEFSHWLSAPMFMLEYDSFPSLANPPDGRPMLPAYPYNWPLLTYLSSRIAGTMLEGSGRMLNVLMLMAFGLMTLKLLLKGAGREMPDKPGWVLSALALIGATLLNPTFVQKIVLTTYADTPTAILVAFSVYVSWRMLEALSTKDDAAAWNLAWQFSLLGLVLINIKQVNLVLAVVILVAVVVVGLRDPDIRFSSLLRRLALMVIPMLVVYSLWRFHVNLELAGIAGGEASFSPFADWNVAIIPLIIKQMLVIAAKKAQFFLVMAIAVGFAIRGLFKFGGSFDRLTILVAVTFLGYNAFLLLTYVGSFGEAGALGAIGYWRYNMHLGLLAGTFGAYGVGILWRKYIGDLTLPAWLKVAPVLLIVVAPLLFPHKLRFDLEDPKRRFNGAAFFAAENIPMEKGLFVLDPRGNGEGSVITRSRTKRAVMPFSNYGTHNSVAAIRKLLSDLPEDGYLIVHSVTPDSNKVLGLELENYVSYLLVRNGKGGWKILRTWAKDGQVVVYE